MPYQLIPICAHACLYTQMSLCERSFLVERGRGECVVGGVCFAGAPQERANLVEG